VRNVYNIDQFETVHNECHFILNEKKQLIQIQSTGQVVIVDSDNEAFLYIIEENNAYSYLQFSKAIWPQLVHMVLEHQIPFLRVEDGRIELNNFVEELIALLFNIEGNGNYGESFVTSVEHVFADFFARNEV
jgi:hypothetical protein